MFEIGDSGNKMRQTEQGWINKWGGNSLDKVKGYRGQLTQGNIRL